MDEDVNEVKGSSTPSEKNTSDKGIDKEDDEVLVVGSKTVVKQNDPSSKISSDGNQNEMEQNSKQLTKNESEKSPVPRIIAKNFKTTKTSKMTDEEANKSKETIEPSPQKTKTIEDCDVLTPIVAYRHVVKPSERCSDTQGLRLKPSKELLNQSDQRENKSSTNGHLNEINPKKNVSEASNTKDRINKLRIIRPKLSANQQNRRSISNDSSTSKMSDIVAKRKTIIGDKEVEGVELNKNNCFWEHKLLNYLSPRLNHPRSHTTNSKPLSSKESSTGKNFGSCPIWIHLLASICTEWEQNSMVLSPGTNVAAKVATVQSPGNTDPSLATSPTVKSPLTQTVTNSRPSAILQALTGVGANNTISGSNNRLLSSFNSTLQNASPQKYLDETNLSKYLQNNKKPKTIHRCILQRVHKPQKTGGGANGLYNNSNLLKCHVCDSSYSTYDKYYNHLMDTTCARKKEEKDAAALAVATVVDAAALYQQESTNMAKSNEQAGPNVLTSPTEEVVEIKATTEPVLSKYKIANLSLCPVTPIFDIPTTESAVQRATTIFQRRRKKILAEVNSLAKNAASSNASKANQQKKLVRKHLDPKETLIGNGHNVENIEKIREWCKKQIMSATSSSHPGTSIQHSTTKVKPSTEHIVNTPERPLSFPLPLISSLQVKQIKDQPESSKPTVVNGDSSQNQDLVVISNTKENTNITKVNSHTTNGTNENKMIEQNNQSFFENPTSPLNLSCKNNSPKTQSNGDKHEHGALKQITNGDDKSDNNNRTLDNPRSNDSNDAPINVVDTDDENGEDSNTLKDKANQPNIPIILNNAVNSSLSSSSVPRKPERLSRSEPINDSNKSTNLLSIQPMSKKRPSIYGSEETELSPTTSVTSISSNRSCSSSFTTNSDATRKRRLSQGSTSDVGCYISANSKKGFSLDKTAASDTLHLLSDSLAAEQSIYIPSEYKLDARKRRRMAPIVAAVAAATVADTSHEVYDNDCPETANVTLVEHAADQARIANLKVQITNLIANILGEERLAALGFPDTDILDILHAVLESARLKPYSLEDTEAEYKEDMNNPGRSSTQIKFKRLRRQIGAARRNVELLLRICIPDRLIWIRNGWDGKRIEEVLQHIITDQARQKIQQSMSLNHSSMQAEIGEANGTFENSR